MSGLYCKRILSYHMRMTRPCPSVCLQALDRHGTENSPIAVGEWAVRDLLPSVDLSALVEMGEFHGLPYETR